MGSPAASAIARRVTVAALVAIAAALVAACATTPAPRDRAAPRAPRRTPSSKYYKDDGPPRIRPTDLDAIPDAVPRPEPLHRFANRPYIVLGRDYVPATSLGPTSERGIASWYGRKFHGQKTSIGEIYDMYAMTAAHPTLPLPSYARVTSVATGKSVVVRVNDRGPFLHGRIIDLSYAAAHRLGIAQRAAARSRSRRSFARRSRRPAIAAGAAAARLPPVVATAPLAAAAPPSRRRGRRDGRPDAPPQPRQRRTAASSCSSARSQNYANAQSVPRARAEPTRRGAGRAQGARRRAGSIASMSDPMPTATRRGASADRIDAARSASPTSVAPH